MEFHRQSKQLAAKRRAARRRLKAKQCLQFAMFLSVAVMYATICVHIIDLEAQMMKLDFLLGVCLGSIRRKTPTIRAKLFRKETGCLQCSGQYYRKTIFDNGVSLYTDLIAEDNMLNLGQFALWKRNLTSRTSERMSSTRVYEEGSHTPRTSCPPTPPWFPPHL